MSDKLARRFAKALALREENRSGSVIMLMVRGHILLNNETSSRKSAATARLTNAVARHLRDVLSRELRRTK